MFDTHGQEPKCPAYSNTLHISFSTDLWACWEETKVTLYHQGLCPHAVLQKQDSLLPCTLSSHPYAHKAKGNCCTQPLGAPREIWLGSMYSQGMCRCSYSLAFQKMLLWLVWNIQSSGIQQDFRPCRCKQLMDAVFCLWMIFPAHISFERANKQGRIIWDFSVAKAMN